MGAFGNQILPTIAAKNWSEFWQKWNQYMDWDLEYYDGADWVSVKSDLKVTKTYPNPHLCKLTLKFTASQNANYRLTFGINKEALSYIHREAESCYSITYDDDTMLFDWNDVLSIPGIVITHGVQDGMFWWRARRNSVPLGAQVTIDPIFGYDTLGSSGKLISDVIVGRKANLSSGLSTDIYATNITVGLARATAGTSNVKCALYLLSDSSLFAETEERSLNLTTTYTWYQFKFPTTPKLTDNTDYVLVAWADSIATVYIAYVAGGSVGFRRYQSQTYDGFPSSASFTTTNDHPSIYCTYSPLCDGGEFFYYFRK